MAPCLLQCALELMAVDLAAVAERQRGQEDDAIRHLYRQKRAAHGAADVRRRGPARRDEEGGRPVAAAFLVHRQHGGILDTQHGLE